jgi:hypothetical protein
MSHTGPRRPPGRLEEITRQQVPYPGPTGGDFLTRLGELDQTVMDLEIEAQHAVESRELAEQALAEGHYLWKDYDAMSRDERRLVAELHRRIALAVPKIEAWEKAKAVRDRMARWADQFKIDPDIVPMGWLESVLGPDDGSIAWQQRAERLISKDRRQRGDGQARGVVLPPSGPVPRNWRG